MPAYRMDSQPRSANKFDIAGQYGSESTFFVTHVGLVSEARSGLRVDRASVPFTHMGPPLENTQADQRVDVLASLELTPDQMRQIQDFVEEVMPENAAEQRRAIRQYVVHPPAIPPSDDRPQFPFWRFSCAGFVLTAYARAGIALVIDAEESWPKVTLDVLKLAYPDKANALARARLRADFGLRGGGPWPVLLPGYLFHSAARDAESVREPYQPQPGDECFPRNAST